MAPMLAVGVAILSLAAQVTAAPAAVVAPGDAVVVAAAPLEERTFSQYAPKPAACPSGPLVRNADSISPQEQAYISKRAPKAAAALKSWLSKIDTTYASASKLPTVALAHSGGGLRSLLISAGVVQAFDARDGSSGKLAGLLQGLTYQGGISGGAWFVSSLYGNNYPTVSNLQKTLWTDAFAQSLLLANLFHPSLKGSVATDVLAKDLAGYQTGLVDIYGRLLSYQLLKGADGGVANTLSGIAVSSNYTNYNVPFPIINGIGLDTFRGACSPALNSTIYEFTPYEFGSWGPGVAAFTPASSLGSNLNNGKANNGKCVSGFDNLGFVLGTSSDVLYALAAGQDSCGGNQSLANASNSTADPGLASLVSGLEDVLGALDTKLDSNLYAAYPNPFKGYMTSSHVSQLDTLELIDGGSSGLNVPVDPFVQPARAVDVLLISDNSADTAAHLPNGSSVYLQYTQSGPQALNLPKMPAFPDPATVVSRGLNVAPSAYGCNDTSKTTLVYLPNHNWTFADAGESTYKIQYSAQETAAMIQNGNAVAYYNGTADWPSCLACIVMKKSTSSLPSLCQACYAKYCYN